MLISFDEIIDITLKHEGGYVHDPKDLGGETNFGIAKRFYPEVDIKNLTKEEVGQQYASTISYYTSAVDDPSAKLT